jgi:hypothetical protein
MGLTLGALGLAAMTIAILNLNTAPPLQRDGSEIRARNPNGANGNGAPPRIVFVNQVRMFCRGGKRCEDANVWPLYAICDVWDLSCVGYMDALNRKFEGWIWIDPEDIRRYSTANSPHLWRILFTPPLGGADCALDVSMIVFGSMVGLGGMCLAIEAGKRILSAMWANRAAAEAAV